MSRPNESKCKLLWASRRKTTWTLWVTLLQTWLLKIWMVKAPMISTILLLDSQNLGKLQINFFTNSSIFMYIAFSSQLSIHKPLWSITTLPQDLTQRTAWSTMLPSARDSEGHLRVEDSGLLKLHGRNALEMQVKWLSPHLTWVRPTSKDGADTTESKKVM